MNHMTCVEFDEAVHEVVRLELLDVTLREQVLDHAARCGKCAQWLGQAKALAVATEAVAGTAHLQQTPARVEVALLASFRQRHHRAVVRRTLEWCAAGALAILLSVVWISSIRPKTEPSSVPKRDISSGSGPLQAAGPAGSAAGGGNLSAITAVPSAQRPQTVLVENSPEAETPAPSDIAGDFVPVPYAEAIAPNDAGMVVRVQLTRASLADLGYPVDAVHSAEWIRADVLVGQDGWPRAVRLLQ